MWLIQLFYSCGSLIFMCSVVLCDECWWMIIVCEMHGAYIVWDWLENTLHNFSLSADWAASLGEGHSCRGLNLCTKTVSLADVLIYIFIYCYTIKWIINTTYFNGFENIVYCNNAILWGTNILLQSYIVNNLSTPYHFFQGTFILAYVMSQWKTGLT